MSRTKFDEGWVDDITADLLEEARTRLAAKGIRLWCAEGYSTAAAHGGTHAGDGAFDLHGSSRTWEQCVITADVLRELGCAAWARGAGKQHGDMIQHIHAVILDHPGLSHEAQRQAAAYLAGFNGLGPSVDFRRMPDYGSRKFLDRRWPGLRDDNAEVASADMIARGSSGLAVLAWTSWLHRMFGYAARVTPGRFFGGDTVEATKEFQRRVGLEADGIVGPDTYREAAKLGFDLNGAA